MTAQTVDAIRDLRCCSVRSYLQKLVCCKHSHSNGVERHQREHVALIAARFVFVTLQLLLHPFLHLLQVLRGLAGAVHIDGLTSRWAC